MQGTQKKNPDRKRRDVPETSGPSWGLLFDPWPYGIQITLHHYHRLTRRRKKASWAEAVAIHRCCGLKFVALIAGLAGLDGLVDGLDGLVEPPSFQGGFSGRAGANRWFFNF